MATVPLSGTNIRLLSGIPFSNDYKNTRWFESKTEQTNYFLARTLVHQMVDANFQRIDGYHFIAVNKSIDELWGTNYLMFQNASYNNKWFYGFVTKLEYKQRNTTYVHFQIDVLQTWKFEMDFKPSFVVREHCHLWATEGQPVVNTIDEGLDYGTMYDTVKVEKHTPNDDIFYLVIVTKSAMHSNASSGIQPNDNLTSINGMPQPLCFYVHPFRMDGTTPQAHVKSNFTLSNIMTVLSSLYEQDDAVNNVVSLYVTDYIGVNLTYDDGFDRLYFPPTNFEVALVASPDGSSAPNLDTIYVKNMPRYETRTLNLGDKYDGFGDVEESKLLMYPYCVTVLDDLKGNRTEIKNEYINGTDLRVTLRGSIGLSNKLTYTPLNYHTHSETDGDPMGIMSGLEYSLINNNPNDVPIKSDMLSAYLQGNRNSLENQKQSILWNGLMNAVGSGMGGIAGDQAMMNAPTRMGALGGAMAIGSAGLGAVKGLGNTALQLQGMEAKKKDISNTPPQLVKMGSNTYYDYGNGYYGLFVIKKQIKPEYRKKLSDFFKMFGYKVHEVKKPNFRTRENWNFVQTQSCNIVGNFNNDDLQELKSVFDNGITLWHTNDVGNYGLPNEVIALG